MRGDVGFLPHLSLVAVREDVVVGHVLATRGWLEPVGVPALGVGPLGVLPAAQGQGGAHFQARRLTGQPVGGAFRYATPFDGL